MLIFSSVYSQWLLKNFSWALLWCSEDNFWSQEIPKSKEWMWRNQLSRATLVRLVSLPTLRKKYCGLHCISQIWVQDLIQSVETAWQSWITSANTWVATLCMATIHSTHIANCVQNYNFVNISCGHSASAKKEFVIFVKICGAIYLHTYIYIPITYMCLCVCVCKLLYFIFKTPS